MAGAGLQILARSPRVSHRTTKQVNSPPGSSMTTRRCGPKTLGSQYRPTKLVLFTDATESGCGLAQSDTGPFYCPTDEKVYIDLNFYEELHTRFGASGDFAQAYVLAHEVGHHVQKVLGIEREMRRAQQANPRAANELSVRMELQADCFAGVWGHSTAQRDKLDPGDVEEGLNAAAAIGDDRIQKQATGRISPEELHARHIAATGDVAAARHGTRFSGSLRYVSRPGSGPDLTSQSGRSRGSYRGPSLRIFQSLGFLEGQSYGGLR